MATDFDHDNKIGIKEKVWIIKKIIGIIEVRISEVRLYMEKEQLTVSCGKQQVILSGLARSCNQ